MYGYQIIKELNRRSNGYFRFKEGTLYPALHRLEKGKLVNGEWEKSPAGQERRYYQITERGRQALSQKLSLWEDFSTAIKAVIQAETS
jgi:PadR family transcriptional regulator PadR